VCFAHATSNFKNNQPLTRLSRESGNLIPLNSIFAYDAMLNPCLPDRQEVGHDVQQRMFCTGIINM
jgi:hypothetical protein